MPFCIELEYRIGLYFFYSYPNLLENVRKFMKIKKFLMEICITFLVRSNKIEN